MYVFKIYARWWKYFIGFVVTSLAYFITYNFSSYVKKLPLCHWPTNELAYLSSTKFILILHFPNVLGNKLSQVKCFLNPPKLKLIFTKQLKFLQRKYELRGGLGSQEV